jgi:hypothetical protein
MIKMPKKLIILGIAIIVVIAVVVGWALIPSVDGKITDWDSVDPNISGEWKTELWIEFEDGTEVLADDFDKDLLSVLFKEPSSDKTVTGLIYKLSARATTDGTYTTAYIDLSSITFGRNVMLAGTTTTIYEGTGPDVPFGTLNIPIDNQFHDLCTYTHALGNQNIQDAVEANPHANGYQFGLYINGGINFRGSLDEDWSSINSPALATITLVAISNELFLDLSGDVVVVYA